MSKVLRYYIYLRYSGTFVNHAYMDLFTYIDIIIFNTILLN